VKQLTELALFAGAGGGLISSHYFLNHKIIGAVEYEPYCQQVLMQRQADGLLNQFPIFGDINDFISQGYAKLYQEHCDLITAGFPCQPFSVAGKSKGKDDPRNMWPQTIECIRQVQPEFIFLENVPGLLVHDYCKQIFGEIAEAGYSFKWTVLGASDVGCLHHRKRLWIFGWKAKNPGRVLFFERKLWEACASPTSSVWRTPECSKGGTVSQEVLDEMGNGNMKRQSGSLRQLRLQDQVLWPTPKRQNANGPGIHGQGGTDLQTSVRYWPTPRAGNPGSRPNGKGGKVLAEEVRKMFPTPTAQDFKRRGPNSKQQGLSNIADMFPSPKSRDWKDGTSEGTQNRHSPDLGKIVGQSKVMGALNPDWVEWLQNWPLCWSSLKPLKEIIFLDPSIDPHPYPPRTTTIKENRANRIKALGNGQTPICMAAAFRILSDGVLE